MSAPVEVRRFLHCNYNCRDHVGLERFYAGLFGLRAVMRSSSSGSDGTPFGIYRATTSSTVFLYDHRGGRRSNALELVHWIDPATTGAVYPRGFDRGIQAVAYSAADLDATAAAATALGGRVVRRGDDWLVLRDPEGVAVEVVRADGPSEARHLRVVCADLERSLAWWSQLGFRDAPQLLGLPTRELWPAEDGRAVSAERGLVGSDDPSFGVVFTTWSGGPPPGPTYAMPYHQGIYRMAVAVDDVQAAYAALADLGVARQPPCTFQLPGTPLTDGLTILFIRDPDNILVELVERRPPAS